MADGSGDVALDEEVVSGLDGDGLGNPPVGWREGERGGAGDAIDGDLVTAGDGEGDVGSWGSTKNGAVDDGGAGIFCQASGELGLFEKEELAAEWRRGVDTWKDRGGSDAGECGDGDGAKAAVEAVAVVLNEGIAAALGELDVAMGVGELRAAPEIASRGEAEEMESGEIEDIAADTGLEVGDGVGKIAEVFTCVEEGVGASAACEDVGAEAAFECVGAITT